MKNALKYGVVGLLAGVVLTTAVLMVPRALASTTLPDIVQDATPVPDDGTPPNADTGPRGRGGMMGGQQGYGPGHGGMWGGTDDYGPGRGGRGGMMGGQQGYGPGAGMMGGWMADYRDLMHEPVAEALGMTLDELETAMVEDNQTMWELAEEAGVDADTIWEAMQQGRSNAIAQALADGIITQEQAEWMFQMQPGQGPCHEGAFTPNAPQDDA